MRIEKTILRSKVARRIFLLFLACSLFPIVVLTVISSRMINGQLEDDGRRRLRQTTKSVGMGILGRLATVESELRTAAEFGLDRDEPGDVSAWEDVAAHLAPRISGLTLITPARVETLFGTALPSRRPDIVQSPPRPGSVGLAVVRDDPGDGRVLLRLVLEPDPRGGRVLIAEVNRDYLWNTDDETAWDQALWIFDPDGRPLFTKGESTAVSAEVLLSDDAAMHREFRWKRDGDEYRGHAWQLFLRAQYGCPNWTVLVTEPARNSLTSLAWARKILPLTVLLCVMVVALLSLVQIRKSLVPIVTLQQGTKEIAVGNFDVRVDVRSNDEFAQLAASFNAMADRLGAQFDTLQTLARIDREMLSSLREEEIVESLFAWAPDRLRCDRIAVALASADEPGVVITRTLEQGGGADAHSTVATDVERPWLFDSGPEVREVDPLTLPPHVGGVDANGLSKCFLLPIRKNAVNGYIVLGFRAVGKSTTERLTEARRLADQIGVALSNARLLEQLERANRETLHALARAVDANSPWTAGHSERVTRLSLKLARRLGLGHEDLDTLYRGGLLHDVGKIGVPSHIVNKPGRLDEYELALMRDHARIGARILEPVSGYQNEIPIVLYHHERYDGEGYPEGLTGEGIPYLARILAVADVFDALISDRPYRESWSISRVIDFIADASGTQFDPEVVSAFLDLVKTENWRECSHGEKPWMFPDFEFDGDPRVSVSS